MTAVVQAGRGIVTPQGVVLDLEVAGIGYRTASRFIDLVALLALILGVAALVFRFFDSTAANISFLIFVFVSFFGYPVVAETYWRGLTLGKKMLGLRIVTLEGGPIGFREAFIRSLFQLIDIGTLGIAALLSALSTDRSQRLGDLAAGTFAIRDQQSIAHVPAVAFTPPMGTEAMVASLDVSKLRPEQERVIRSFLLRVGELSGASRLSLGDRLAASTAELLGHNVETIGSSETYLVSVMAARQLREGGLADLAIKDPSEQGKRSRRRRFRK